MYRPLQFHKRSQLFIRTHNETLSVARCASAIQIVRPLESIAETQPQLQPALLRLSAIISQFFIRFRAIALMIISVGLNCGFEFEKGRQLLICMHNKASGVLALCGHNPFKKRVASPPV